MALTGRHATRQTQSPGNVLRDLKLHPTASLVGMESCPAGPDRLQARAVVAQATETAVFRSRALFVAGRAARALGRGMALLRRVRGAPGAEAPPDSIPGLAAELRRLDGAVRDGTARGLAMLWEDFLERCGGPELFREAGEVARQEYLERLRGVRETMARDRAQRPTRSRQTPWRPTSRAYRAPRAKPMRRSRLSWWR
jgi:hypothetical protein